MKEEEETDGSKVRIYSHTDTARRVYLKRIPEPVTAKKAQRVVKYPTPTSFWSRSKVSKVACRLSLSTHSLYLLFSLT